MDRQAARYRPAFDGKQELPMKNSGEKKNRRNKKMRKTAESRIAKELVIKNFLLNYAR